MTVSAGDRAHPALRLQTRVSRVRARVLERAGWQARVVPLHGYGNTSALRILAKLVYAPPSTPVDHFARDEVHLRRASMRGWRNFTWVPAARTEARVRVDGRTFPVHSSRTGLIDAVLPVSLPPGTHDIEVAAGADPYVRTRVTVLAPERTDAVICDVDDTIMVTMLPRPLVAARNSFIASQSTRRTVPGMPALLARTRAVDPDRPVFYVSTGAWSIYPVLRGFLARNALPDGPILLTDWGPSSTSFFRSGKELKAAAIERLHDAFPRIRWLLIGDDGQHDPEIYGNFAARHPESVRAIGLRRLSTPQQLLAHGAPTPPHADLPPSITVEHGRDGFELLDRLTRAGVLP